MTPIPERSAARARGKSAPKPAPAAEAGEIFSLTHPCCKLISCRYGDFFLALCLGPEENPKYACKIGAWPHDPWSDQLLQQNLAPKQARRNQTKIKIPGCLHAKLWKTSRRWWPRMNRGPCKSRESHVVTPQAVCPEGNPKPMADSQQPQPHSATSTHCLHVQTHDVHVLLIAHSHPGPRRRGHTTGHLPFIPCC